MYPCYYGCSAATRSAIDDYLDRNFGGKGELMIVCLTMLYSFHMVSILLLWTRYDKELLAQAVRGTGT